MSREKHNWGKLVYQFAESGLPASVWCEQNGIAPSTFYLHLKEQRELASVSDPESMPKHPESHEIVKLDFDEDNAINDYSNVSPDSSSIPRIAVTVQLGKATVNIISGADRETITATLQILEALC